MSWATRDNEECVKCGFEAAHYELNCKNREEWLQCHRCGFMHTSSIDEAKNTLPGPIVYKSEKSGGRGNYVYSRDGAGSVIGTATREAIAYLREHSTEFVKCKYTYRRKGQWFIKDLLTGQRVQFSYESFMDSPSPLEQAENGKETQVDQLDT